MYFIEVASFLLFGLLFPSASPLACGLSWCSRSQGIILDILPLKKLARKIRRLLSIPGRPEPTYGWRLKEMTEDTVVDVSQDWVLACDVQRRFMQDSGSRMSGCVDCSGHCRQVRAVGGDCYEFLPLTDNRLAFVVGDASGKGLAAALMIANVQSSLRTAALFAGHELASLLKVVNQQAYTSSLADRYATVFYGVLDGATYNLHYVNAGHNAPLVLRPDGAIERLEGGGAPVGMFPDSNYEESIVHLGPGDLVIAYTDGVIEAVNGDGEEWGLQSLLKATAASRVQHAEDVVRLIFDSMDDFSRGFQTDDATVAVLRVL
jgi:sigma-B regulation protein RsbU (phosphoserine phosphatase)